MKNNFKLQIPTAEFKLFLKTISKVNTSVILKIKDYKIEVLTAADAVAGRLVLLITLDLPKVDTNNVEAELPIIDIKKLQNICDFTDSETIELVVQDNLIKFNGSNIKVKLHLSEASIISVPAHVTSDKFRQFNLSFNCNVQKNVLDQVVKGQAFIKSSITDLKLYLYNEDNKFYGELTDLMTAGSDSFKILLSENYTGNFQSKVPIKIDSWNLMNIFTNEVEIQSEAIQRKSLVYNIVILKQTVDKIDCRYMFQGQKG